MAKLARKVGGGLDAVVAMTGHKDLKLANHYTHLTLVGSKYTLAYDDPRRFGHMYYFSKDEAQKKLLELGMDLTDPEFGRSKCCHRKGNGKE